ncbi:MAG: methyltransferase domain-containing protein [Planctomycetia bacterium]|nr:methyltransferase domain-containing protein [Planctomycetia bacterium]
MSKGLSEYRVFWGEFRRNFHTTGALAPSSRYLARALARFVRVDGSGNGRLGSGPRRILEVGPGTGAVTREIVRRLGPDDTLDLVELNATFVEMLRRRLEHDKSFAAVAPRVRIIHDRVESLPLAPTYDVIISGLPLNNFSRESVESILEALEALVKPGGTVSFFEYVAVRPMRRLVSGRKERDRLRDVGEALQSSLKREVRRDCVLANLPPAWVHHLRFGEKEA